MFSLARPVFAPLLSLFIFILGSGLFTKLLTIHLHQDEDAFVTMPQTTPILAELDRRVDSEFKQSSKK